MKKIKNITIILAIVLISMIAFIGVYNQKQNRMENIVKGYSYAMDIKGTRNVRLTVNQDSETVIKDKDGKEVEDSESLTDEQITENGYTKEEVPYNSENVLTEENYNKSKEVIEKRLKKLNVDNYNIRLDEQTGDIIIELTEDDNTDSVVGNLYTTGEFKIIDTETKEVLMNNDDIKKSKVMYGSDTSSTTSAGTTVYLDIEFTKEGGKKLEDISNKYVKTTDTTATEETSAENTTSTDATQEGEVASTETTEEQTNEKTITMMVDDQEIMSTSFDETIKTGKIQLSVGQASTDNETLQGYIDQASSMATVLDSGKIPVKYDVSENEYVLSDVSQEQLDVAKYIAFTIVGIGLIVLIVRYGSNGILGAFSYIGLFSIMVILVRYTNVVLSIEGLCAIGLVLMVEYIFINKMLQKVKQNNEENNKEIINKNIKEAYMEFFISIIPVCIAVITFCFIKWIPLSSFGMVMFWGITLIAIYNFIVTTNLLKINADKK